MLYGLALQGYSSWALWGRLGHTAGILWFGTTGIFSCWALLGCRDTWQLGTAGILWFGRGGNAGSTLWHCRNTLRLGTAAILCRCSVLLVGRCTEGEDNVHFLKISQPRCEGGEITF